MNVITSVATGQNISVGYEFQSNASCVSLMPEDYSYAVIWYNVRELL